MAIGMGLKMRIILLVAVIATRGVGRMGRRGPIEVEGRRRLTRMILGLRSWGRRNGGGWCGALGVGCGGERLKWEEGHCGLVLDSSVTI